MTDDTLEQPRTAAIEQLERFGLSNYASRTFVALSALGSGTAREVSNTSDVPRTRVYDAIDELHDWGLVDIQNSSPKRFWAISAETACRTFEHELKDRTSILSRALGELEPVDRRTNERGVWTVEGEAAVTTRVLDFFETAEDEIVYMTVENLLDEDIVEGLADAADRGVSIKLSGLAPSVQDRLHDHIPGATVFESLWVWSDTPAGRIMMVDKRKTLASVRNGASAEGIPGLTETAIWGEGETNSLVVVLRSIFTWRLEGEPGA